MEGVTGGGLWKCSQTIGPESSGLKIHVSQDGRVRLSLYGPPPHLYIYGPEGEVALF